MIIHMDIDYALFQQRKNFLAHLCEMNVVWLFVIFNTKQINKDIFSISDAFVHDHVNRAEQTYDAKDLDGFFKNAVALRFLDLVLPKNSAKDSIANIISKLHALHRQVGSELAKLGQWELKNYLWQAMSIVPAAGANLRAVLANRLHELEAVLTGETLSCVANAIVMEWHVAVFYEQGNKRKIMRTPSRIFLVRLNKGYESTARNFVGMGL